MATGIRSGTGRGVMPKDPWSAMATPNQDFTFRLVMKPCPVSTFWAKDSKGRCLFIIVLEGDHISAFRNANPRVKGLDIDLRTWKGSQVLILTLVIERDRDLFHALCEELVRLLNLTANRTQIFPAVINHLKRWQRFLSGVPQDRLSDARIRGLFAELQFLRRLYQSHLSRHEAIESWKGPDGCDQDFIYCDTAVEVKAASAATPNELNIASEAQLDPTTDRMFLGVYVLHQNTGKPGEESLDEFVQAMETDLQDSLVLQDFLGTLEKVSYVGGAHKYDTPCLKIDRVRFFRVEGGFPRIQRSQLPDGIHRVRYQLSLDRLKPYECTPDTIFNNC